MCNDEEKSVPNNNHAIIDIQVYEELKKYIQSNEILDIYEDFESETLGFIEKLKILIPAKNYPEILSILHTIKGNAGSLGITVLTQKSEEIEQALKEGQRIRLEEDFKILISDFNDFVDNYRRILK